MEINSRTLIGYIDSANVVIYSRTLMHVNDRDSATTEEKASLQRQLALSS